MRGARAFSLYSFKKHTSCFKKYSNTLKKKEVKIKSLPLFPPSLRLKETQAKPVSLIPPRALVENYIFLDPEIDRSITARDVLNRRGYQLCGTSPFTSRAE
jgi:hypothetical protein